MNQLETLSTEFPLSSRWQKPELFIDAVTLGDANLHLAGLATTDSKGTQIVGSAGELGQLPLARAYFELLERTCVVEAEEGSGPWQLRSLSTEIVGQLARNTLFPVSPNPERWRFARSNGVAAGASWEKACLAAGRELIERDRLLRSWLGQVPAVQVPLNSVKLPKSLETHYEMAVYLFPAGTTAVAACFAFPRDKSRLVIRGFGAKDEAADAIETALAECLQSMGFLWTETSPETAPAFSPTPDYHQEYYLNPSREPNLKAWLNGARKGTGTAPETQKILGFVDLTPPALESRLFVVKAYGEGLLPLLFGEAPESLYPGISEAGLHPIS